MNLANKLSAKNREEMYKWYEQKVNDSKSFAESLYYWKHLEQFRQQVKGDKDESNRDQVHRS